MESWTEDDAVLIKVHFNKIENLLQKHKNFEKLQNQPTSNLSYNLIESTFSAKGLDLNNYV
jgi:hypothetical protein